ncbi:MAG: Npt1/Npt2 family nucleotide transporter [Anaerolineales bacterium]|nr:MAG: Npt1/Npt2 family nucleotide transporter [Anaerolineales bacterium]
MSRFLNLKSGELKLAFSLWLLIAINTLVLELSDVVATAGFVSNLGVDKVPLLWIGTTLLTMFAVGGYLVVIDRYPRLQLVSWLLIGLAALYLLLQFMFAFQVADWITYPVLYLLADQQFMIMPLAFWALANDVYAVSESKRIFPFIASGAVIGGLIGNGTAAWVTYLAEKYSFGLSQIFTAIAVVLILSAAFLQFTFLKTTIKTRQSREEDAGLRDTIRIGLDYFLNIPAFKAVGILMLLTGFILTLIEFNFLFAIDVAVGSDLEFQRFLGYYKAVQTSGLLMFQWLVTSRLLAKIQLKKAFAVLPSAMFIASGLALGVSTMIGAASARFVARTVYTAWDDPSRKALQGLVPDERRGRISAFMDSYFITTATVLGCILLVSLLGLESAGLITRQVVRWIYLGIAVGASISGIVTSVYLWRSFDTSMLNYRLARSKRKSMLDGIEF